MKITRRFTQAGQDVFATTEYDQRTSRISNPDGSVVFEMRDAEIPRSWSQLATDIMVSKYFRKAGVPQRDAAGNLLRDEKGNVVLGPERSARQVIHRLAGCWRFWGETHGYFDTEEDAQAFYDELAYMLLNQMCAPNSPQWFNTGLHWAYGITGPAQGHFYCDPRTGEMRRAANAYEHPQPHACQPFHALVDTIRGPVAIGDLVTQSRIGEEVYDGTDEGRGVTRIVAVASNGKKEVFKVHLDNRNYIEATADHLVYASSGGAPYRFCKLSEIAPGARMLQRVEVVEDTWETIQDRTEPFRNDDGEWLPAGRYEMQTDLVSSPQLEEVVVTAIESLGAMEVFDIQTESGQYLSNNVIVHNCFIQSVSDDLVNEGGIMDLWTREARLFKYGSGTGSNFSRLRGENEPLSGGGKSSGLMSFLKIGDRAAGAIKSGGTTRRAAKMVCLDLDHPDIENFVNWKVREELKVACLVEGLKVLPGDQQELAKKIGLKLSYDFNGEAYYTVSGQNSNNSVRIPNRFFKAVEEDGDWTLTFRTNGKPARTLKARDLWDQIAFAAWRCADPGVQYDDTINQWHTCPKSGRINASNPCVTGDTRVLTPGGIWRRIDTMLHLPARLVTNAERGQEIHVTDGAFPTGTRDVFELQTAGGYSVKLTADHQVLTRDRGWVQAKDLTDADELRLPALPAAVVEVGEPQDPRLFQLVGLMLSTRNEHPDAIDLERVLGTHSELVEPFATYASDVGAEGETVPASAEAEPSTGAVLTTTVTQRRLIDRIRAFVRYENGQKRLTDDAFTAGLAAQKHLLRGLVTADAIISGDEITLPLASRGLAQDVQLLLIGFGIRSVVRDATLFVPADSLRAFVKHVAALPGTRLPQLARLVESYGSALPTPAVHFDRVASLTPLGAQPVYDLTEPTTHSFVANGLTVHNCSEYMFLDDTACNLASLNVLRFFDSDSRRFDVESYKHAIRIWTVVLEISVLMASFPSEEIARLSYRYRTLGLGYANLGAVLMQAGIAYDSEKARALCGALTAILTGESYATSAEMAREHGPFAGYHENRDDMLRVIRNHRRAAYHAAAAEYESLDIHPVPIDERQFDARDPLVSPQMLHAARECWDRALELGERHGYRNAQSTVIAPTGTIGLLMDCDTTGVEPDFALVKFKKLAGGGYFKIANNSLVPALHNLGYPTDQIRAIVRYVMGTLTLDGAPHVNRESLLDKGIPAAVLDRIEQALPGTFELKFAFTVWSVGDDVLRKLGISADEAQKPDFNLLRKLGFTRRQIDEANDVICGCGTVEGAPHLKPEHYAVFDCANKCGKLGTRFIAPEGHIRMMAAAQPFISGAISKTINLPNEADVEQIKRAYELSWKLGLKANALYRDGSKLSQPLNIKSDDEIDADDESEENVSAAKEEVAALVAGGAATVAAESSNVEFAPDHTRVIEKIVERVVERPLRRRLPDTRHAITHKFDVAQHEGYITVGLYEDGSPGEVFITMAKEGSTIGGLMDTIATLVSVALQYGVPIDSLVRKFEHVRFEPNGPTRNADIPFAKSIVDYIFRWLAMEFITGYRELNAPQRARKEEKPAAPKAPAADPIPAAEPPAIPAAKTNGNGNGHGNGHSHPIEPDAKPFDYGSGLANVVEALQQTHQSKVAAPVVGGRLGAAAADPLSQQGAAMQADAPACDVCGSITVRSGTCYKCNNCGNSMGCS